MKEKQFEIVDLQLSDACEAPRGDEFFYRCRKCNGIIPSAPENTIGCSCENIIIDLEYFRIAVRDLESFEVLRKVD